METIINYFKNISKTKLILFLILSVLVVLAVVFAWDYFITQKVVTLNPSLGTNITIGKQKGDEIAISKPIANTNSFKKIRLQPGLYVVKFAGTKDYQEETESININKPIEITTPKLNYTDTKLSQLLKSEKPAIQNSLLPFIPNTGYKINVEKLFKIGNWYGAQLIPGGWYDPTVPADLIPRPANNNNTQDMLKVIMKKGNGVWKVLAGPSIVISIADYPDIPQDVIRATNKLGLY